MIGYCKDGKYMALVYEYMSEGTLREHISGMYLSCCSRSIRRVHCKTSSSGSFDSPHDISPFCVLFLFAGKRNNGRYLTWRERLRIALESAQGNYFKIVILFREV